VKVVTWNVNGIRARAAEVEALVSREAPDVLCLQELKAAAAQVPEPLATLPGYWGYWHGARAYSGVSLHVRQAACAGPPAFGHPAFDHEQRIVTVALGTTTVASVYVPNGGKDFPAKLRFLEAMAELAGAVHAAGGTLVVCGDLNVTHTDRDVHEKERKAGVIGQRPDERARLQALLEHGLVDLGRALHPDDDQLFTWWPPWRNLRQRNIGWRLDYVLASEALASLASACVVLADHGTSDHAPVVAVIDQAPASG
jgi:exodeoxyribonuclease-3